MRDSCDLPSQWILSQRKRRLSKAEADVADLKEADTFIPGCMAVSISREAASTTSRASMSAMKSPTSRHGWISDGALRGGVCDGRGGKRFGIIFA